MVSGALLAVASAVLAHSTGTHSSVPRGDALRYGAAPAVIEAVEMSAALNSYRKGNTAFDAAPSRGFVVEIDFSGASTKPAASH